MEKKQTKKKNEGLEKLRHSAAHLLAQALLELYPTIKLTIGPATPNGFFYDFLLPENLKQKNLQIVADKMLEIANRDLPITHGSMPKKEARALYKDNPFKLELIDGIEGDSVGIARQGDFYDLCKGGHVASTGLLKHFKLTLLAGSYWRADKKKQALQRIGGVIFPTAKELRVYEKWVEETKKYDHRKLGKELDLFSFHEEGVGFPFFHANGKKIINLLIDFLRTELDADGYQEIATPVMLSDELWKRSGHYDHYKDNMYFSTIEERSYAIRPMNCPGSILVYKNRPRSFRDLPFKLSEFGLVHRHELSGVLHGLFRVRAFVQDDAHIYCTPEQIEEEILKLTAMVSRVLKRFEFANIKVALSTKPEKAMGSDELWEKATAALESALKKTDLQYTVSEGDGAFYGPKIDFIIEDSMGREWQCSTIQLDFFQPENFDLHYIASGGKKKRPVMIHRAIYGSLERFFGILIEHYKGRFPFWLAPVQVKVLTITDEQKSYAATVAQALKEHGIRTVIDKSSDQISAKIKAAQLQKIPWMLVLGKKEQESGTITLRKRDGKQEFGLTQKKLLEKAKSLLTIS